MNENNRMLDLANRLERILCQYLDCHYNDFGVKANDNLTTDDWRSPINFALGHRYACSSNDKDLKEKIDFFLGETLIGDSIGDIIKRHKDFSFPNADEAYSNIERIIDELENILKH